MRRHLFQWTAAVAAICSAGMAHAVLVSQWMFNEGDLSVSKVFPDEKVDDGVLNPTLTYVDPTNEGSLTGGQADLSFNSGQTSNQAGIGTTAPGIYLDLTDFTISDMAYNNGADTRAVSFEMWVTVSENRDWSRLWDFGTSTGGPDVSNGGVGQNYMIGVARSGPQDFRATTRSNAAGDPEIPIIGGGPLATGTKHHVVYTLDHNDTTAGAFGTTKLYLNNTLVGTAAVADEFDVSNNPDVGTGTSELIDNNNWFGRAQFDDQLFDGLYDEIRLYNHALTEGEVMTNFAEGPVPSSLPQLNIDRLTGAMSLINAGQNAVTLDSYTLLSPAGAFIPGEFNAIDPPALTATENELTEDGITSGGTIGAGDLTGISLGSAYQPSSIENITASVELTNGTITEIAVNFIGNGGLPLSPLDLDTDGVVDEDDFLKFASHAYTDISGLSDVQQAIRGDLDGDNDNDFTDFLLFKQQFNALNGAGALEAIMAKNNVSIPEPSAIVLGGLAACGAIGLRRRVR